MKILSFASKQSRSLTGCFLAFKTLRRQALVLAFAGFGTAAATLGADAAQNSPLLSSSVDVREDASAYTVQLTLPEKDSANLDVRMDGKNLRIQSGAPGGARQEQSFSLPHAQKGAAMNMKRENGNVVITVPKGSRTGDTNGGNFPQASVSQSDNFDSVRSRILSQFARMRQQMDQMMNMDSNDQADPFQALLSGSGLMPGMASGMGTAFQLQEQKDKYILSAQIPEEQAKNIKIAVDNDRVLKITSEEKSSSGNGGFSSSQSSNFTQAMSLPGPVKTDQVSMDYKDGRFEITLPKA